jgi:hypothetical protein
MTISYTAQRVCSCPGHESDCLCPSIQEHLADSVQHSRFGGMYTGFKKANCCRAAPVDVRGGVHIGSRIDEELRELRQIERNSLAIRLDAI